MARRCQNNYKPIAQITDNDLRMMAFLFQARCADTGNLSKLGLYSTKNGSLSGVYKRLKRLECSGYLRSYRLPLPVFEEIADKNGKTTNRLVEDARRIWLLRGAGIKVLRQTGAEEYQSGTSVYNQAQRLAPPPSNFAHEVFALHAVQSLEALLTDDENVCRITASERQLRKEQARAEGKSGFYDFSFSGSGGSKAGSGGSKVNPDWALEVTNTKSGKKKLVLLEYDQGFYRRNGLRRKLDMVNGDDDYWNEVAKGYDKVQLYVVGANVTVSERHRRWLKKDVGGEFNKLREVIKFFSLRGLMGDEGYDGM